MPLYAVDGSAVTTVEGLGSTRTSLGEVQRRIADAHGSHTFLKTHPRATAAEIEHSLDGNLCRCTGYRPILDAAKTISS